MMILRYEIGGYKYNTYAEACEHARQNGLGMQDVKSIFSPITEKKFDKMRKVGDD